jgi:hypothetical protein
LNRQAFAKMMALLALVIFVLSLLAHLATFVPSPTVEMSKVWFLHVAMFIPFVAMVLILHRRDRALRKSGRWTPRLSQPEALRLCPRWAKALGIVVVIYVGVNFTLFMRSAAGQGTPVVETDGTFVLKEGSRTVRTLTENEYRQLQARVVRGFSGHWLFFSYIPLVYFGVIDRRMTASEPAARSELTT